MGCVFVLLAPGAAVAASFDCGGARLPMEKAICGDRVLSAADSVLANNYGVALSRLSPVGQVSLRDSQRSFLHYASDLCRPGSRPIVIDPVFRGATPPPDTKLVVRCLVNAFGERTTLLKRAALLLGGHVFVTTATYRVHGTITNRVDGSAYQEAVHSKLQLIQIDDPKTDEERNWNAAVRTALATSSDGIYADNGTDDVDVPMNIVSASPSFIGTAIEVSIYAKGSPHPQDDETSLAWSLALNRKLSATDIFDHSTNWNDAVCALIRKQIEQRPDGGDIDASRITKVAAIGTWHILPRGIEFTFGPYMLGGYTSAASTLLTWQQLAPYLRHDLPFRPAELLSPPPQN